MSSIILTHGDCDGVCSGAIVKRALNRPDVFFISPVSLLGDLNSLTGAYDNIVICDIAIDERTYPELKEKLNELAEISNIFYIDHHPLPMRKYSADWFYHDECSTAEMANTLFSRKLNRDMRRVAIYGAIGEFAETPIIQKWERDWDKRALYFFAGTLVQGIIEAGRNYDCELPSNNLDGFLLHRVPTETTLAGFNSGSPYRTAFRSHLGSALHGSKQRTKGFPRPSNACRVTHI